jgi:hypothetical protein
MTDPIDHETAARHVGGMEHFVIRERTIDMTPDGQFRSPPRYSVLGPGIGARLLRIAIIVAVLAGAAAFAALAFWLAMIMIPIALGAGLIAWAMMRLRLWQAGRGFRRPGAPW